MLKKRTSYLWLLFGAVSIIFVGYIAALHFRLVYASDKICKEYPYPHAKDCATYDPGLVFLRQIVETANYLSPTIVALAAVAVAVFTLTLKWSTDKLWDSGERSIIEQHRPWVFVKSLIWEPEKSYISIIFFNSGATPARQFKKAISGLVLPVPFPSAPLLEPDDRYSTFLAPGASEILTLDKPPTMISGFEYRIRISLSYMLQNGSIDALYEDFSCSNDGRIRKVTPKDYAAYNGGDTYTIGESYTIPK